MVVWGLLAALAAGITYRYSPLYTLPIVALIFALSKKYPFLRSGCIVVFFPLLFFYGQHSARMLRYERQHAQTCFAGESDANDLVMEGWVSSFPQAGAGRSSFLFRTDACGREVQLLVYANTVGIAYGDSLRICGKLLERRGKQPPEDPEVDPYLFSRGAACSFRARKYGVMELPGYGGSRLKRRLFWPLHNRLRVEILRRLGGNSGIPLALLLGERGELDKKIRRTFVELGISHLLALSGMHLGLIAAAILLLMRRFRVRNLAPLLVILALYLGTVGEVLSLYRAFGMAVFLILAKMIRRPMNPMRALGTAAFLLLLWSPHIFFSVGFQLSFAATFAVLLCMTSVPMWKTKNPTAKLVNYTGATIFVGTFVQLFIAPLLIHHFGRLSIVSPLATLVFFPFVLVVFFLSILCAGCGSLCPALGDFLAAVLSPVNRAFASLLLSAEGISPPLIHLLPADTLIYCAAITLIWRSNRTKWKILIGTLLLVASFLRPHV